jgi:NADPH:quinone reductase-like Zn-dependent oxidoreductase
LNRKVNLFNSKSFIARCRIKRGEILLVHGASGAVGIAAVQIAKAYGKPRNRVTITFKF